MLNAIIHGKAGRIELGNGTETLSWRQLYQQREDLLTAAFFSRFTYLSGLLQHRLLKQWLGGVGDFTAFEKIDYWPRYDLEKRDDRNFVEPDLLLNFEDCDLLIEVKPPKGGDQYQEQWQLEIEGYFAQEKRLKPLYFLAIGRIGSVLAELDDESLQEKYPQFQKANAIGWKAIASQLRKCLIEGDLDVQDRRIIEDMQKALSLYGIRVRDLRWEDLHKLTDEAPLNLDSLTAWSLYVN
ncbi:MAG: hypothetical protein D6B28_05150 [Gammaproteobacteria bacterium]|nr:MAG: hypothetical protein D6B28_05150 [Gammaproteobacteria bacterium]